MAGGHDQLWKDLIQAFPADFVRLAGPDLAARLAGTIEFQPAEAHTGAPRGKERRLDLIAWAESRHGERALLHVEIELNFRTATAARLLAYKRPARSEAEMSLEDRGSQEARRRVAVQTVQRGGSVFRIGRRRCGGSRTGGRDATDYLGREGRGTGGRDGF